MRLRLGKQHKICGISIALFGTMQLQIAAVSMVYNFRIAQLTKQPIFDKPDHRHHSVIGLAFEQFYKKYSGENRNYAGALASYIFDFSQYYLRIDGAVASILAWAHDANSFSGKATDDILLTIGKNFIFDRDHATVTFSGLFGMPTHRIHELEHPDFGSGQLGLGLQLDGLYKFNRISSFIYGTRYIYFVPRNALDPSCLKHRYTIGNIADILVASKQSWDHHGFELGYTARFDFGARCCPLFDEMVHRTNYIRSNFYAVYKYKFKIKDVANRFLLNFGYGFDHTPKKFGNKYILTFWASWNINF